MADKFPTFVAVAHTDSYACARLPSKKIRSRLCSRLRILRYLSTTHRVRVYGTPLFVAFKLTQSEPYWLTTNNTIFKPIRSECTNEQLIAYFMWLHVKMTPAKVVETSFSNNNITIHLSSVPLTFLLKWWWWWWCNFALFFRPGPSVIALWWKTVSWFWIMGL